MITHSYLHESKANMMFFVNVFQILQIFLNECMCLYVPPRYKNEMHSK